MSAEACLKKAVAAGAELYVKDGRLRGRGPRPEPELAAILREHEAEIVALLALRESAAPAVLASAGTSAVDRAALHHQRRIAAKEADLAFQGLGPDGKTPLAEYQRLAAEAAKIANKTAPDSEDRQRAAGRKCLPSKTANSPLTNGSWPEPKIAKDSHFGVDEVPNRYKAGWQDLLAANPSWASPWQWETAIFSCRDLFGEWGAELLRLNWQPKDIFGQWTGLTWFLKGRHVTAIGVRHAFIEDGRIFERTGR
jgi:hypothetical protein